MCFLTVVQVQLIDSRNCFISSLQSTLHHRLCSSCFRGQVQEDGDACSLPQVMVPIISGGALANGKLRWNQFYLLTGSSPERSMLQVILCTRELMHMFVYTSHPTEPHTIRVFVCTSHPTEPHTIKDISPGPREAQCSTDRRYCERKVFWICELGTLNSYGLKDKMQSFGFLCQQTERHTGSLQVSYAFFDKHKRRCNTNHSS